MSSSPEKAKRREDRRPTPLCAALSFAVPAALLLAFFFSRRIVPFGDTSPMYSDMRIQYVDFFCWLKDVLQGRAGAGYSFSQSLGASPIALLGYYLSSPLNLLVVFFPKTQLPLFFSVLSVLKVGLIGLCFSIFLSRRFRLKTPQVVSLACAYACTQYVFGQLTNIMWLDGVCLLPILLLGVSRFVRENKKGLFYVSVALTVLFNWYTGYMNCLFAVLFYAFEVQTLYPAGTKFSFRTETKRLLQFLSVEALGVLLSCFWFLPVVFGQMGGRTPFENDVFKFGTNGSFLDLLHGFIMGARFPNTRIVLFCSVLVLLFFFAFWLSRRVSRREKIAAGALLGVMLFSEFFQPLEHIWVGFKYEWSYQFRFAYLTFAVAIFIAAAAMERLNASEKKDADKDLFRAALLFTGILLVCDWHAAYNPKHLWFQIALIFCYAGLFALRGRIRKKTVERVLCATTAILFCVEIVFNARWNLWEDCYHDSALYYENYVSEQTAQVEAIKAADPGVWRMEQTANRDKSIFNANESLAFGYRSLQSYTSTYSRQSFELMRRMGYYCVQEFPSVYYDHVLPSDSFLGVKYLLTDREYPGLIPTDFPEANGKKVYENPYALPLAFETKTLAPAGNSRSFDAVNELYSAVLGRETEVFQKTAVLSVQKEGADVVVLLDTEKKIGQLLYGSFLGTGLVDQSVLTDNEFAITYTNAAWGGWHDVCFFGEVQNAVTEIRFPNAAFQAEDLRSEFCTVDLASFGEICGEIRAHAPTIEVFEDGAVSLRCESESETWVLLTVPFDEQWQIRVNGERVSAVAWADTITAVPVPAGICTVTLTYHARGFAAGALLSLFSLAAFAALCFVDRRSRKNR